MQIKLRWLLLGGLGAAALGLGAALFLMRQRSPSTEGAVPLPSVSITSPAHRSEFPLGSPVVVEVNATAGVPIRGLELWIDGRLLGYQQVEEVGGNAATATFLWSPSSAAVHALAARSLAEEGPLAYSDTIHVGITEMVVDQDRGDTVDHPVPAVLPAADEAAPIPGPAPSDDVSQAQPIQAGGEPPSSAASGKPAAPELVAQVQACAAKLSIHDLSDDEAGFEVFRQSSKADGWLKVATLAGESGNGWLAYSDDASPGGFTYYVAAYNEGGSSPSNMVLLNIDPESCGSSEDGGQGLQVDLAQLLGDSPADQYYCYQTMDNNHWSRLPQDGFFVPAGQDGGNAPEAVISLANYSSEGETSTLQLLLECWGWQGSHLQKLGEFAHKIDLNNLTDNDGSLMAAALTPINLGSIAGYYPLDGDVGDVEIGVFKGLPVLEPTMSSPAAFVTYEPDECMSHLMPDAQNLLGKILFCTPAPGFDSGSGGGNPQPYLVWNFFKGCSAGYGSPPCKTYQEWLDMAQANDGEVTFRVYDSSSAGLQVHNVTAPGLRSLTIPQVDCSGPRTFWVGMRYSDADQSVFGPNSNFVTIDCPKALPWEIPLDITYDTITFSNLDDGESDPDDVEVYGYLKAAVPGGQTRYMNLAEWDEQGDCPDESVKWPGSLNDQGLLITDGCTKTFNDGSHSLSTVAVCQGTSKQNCAISGWDFQNNVTRINALQDTGLWLYLTVYDWDDASGNDLQCWSVIEFKARTRFEWAQVQNEEFSFIGFDQGNGNCTVHGHINAVLP